MITDYYVTLKYQAKPRTIAWKVFATLKWLDCTCTSFCFARKLNRSYACAIYPIFTTKHRLLDLFFQTFVAFELFSRGIVFIFAALEIRSWKKIIKFCIFKLRLGGDFSWSVVITHMGHWSSGTYLLIHWDNILNLQSKK